MRIPTLLLAVLLSGCVTTEYVDRPVEVMIPMPVLCLQPGDVPELIVYPVDELTANSTDGAIVGALLATTVQQKEIEGALRALIGACTTERYEF